MTAPDPGPVPAAPTPGPDTRCAPPSDCWMAWEWDVSRRVEAVAKLAREEIAKTRGQLADSTDAVNELRAELAAATARFAAEQAAYVKELDELRAENERLLDAGQLLHEKTMEVWRERADLRAELAGPNSVAVRLRRAMKVIDELRAENAELRRQAADELSREGQEMGLDDDPHTATHAPVYMWLYNDCLIRIRYHPVSGKRQYVQTPSKDLQGLILDEVPAGASQMYLRNVGRPAEEVAMGLDQ